MRVRAALGLCAVALWPAIGAAQAPLSAIDWLSDVHTTPLPPPLPPSMAPPLVREEDVSRGVISETILVTPLDAPNADAVGLLPREVSGLPGDLWGPSTVADLAGLLAAIDGADLVPATRELLFTLLLAELAPPIDSDGSGTFLLARTATLTRLGAVEQAFSMLDRAGIATPEQFAQWFDLSVFLGRETEACQMLSATPLLARDLGTRIFCLARLGDWSAAALSFETARALGRLDARSQSLLLRFLDVELDDSAARLPIPDDPTPLVFHLFEAIGEPLPTTSLPLPFAHADLRANTGWKAQVEAAERLARAGALPANQLLGLYTTRRPAASGGVWDRVTAVQAFDLAISSGDADAVRASLPTVWEAMQLEHLSPAFAALYAARLRLFPLAGLEQQIGLQMGLLTEDYELIAQQHSPSTATERLMVALAQGDTSALAPQGAMRGAIAEAFAQEASPPARFRQDLEARAVGATILRAIALLGDGREGDLGKVTDALGVLRALGLERVARRAALEMMVLDQRG